MKPISKRDGLLLFAGGLALALVGPFLIPVPPLKGTYAPRELADSDSEFIQLEGMDIHLKRKGQGEPVFILLHGFAVSLDSWQTTMDQLSQFGTVIAYDRPGFGLSERPLSWQGKNPYSAQAQVDLAVSLLDHFGVQQAILVGNSAGGALAIQMAISYPGRVSAMILVDPAVYHGGGVPGYMQTLLATPQMRRLGPLITRQILSRGRKMFRYAWGNPGRMPVEVEEQYLKPFKVENWDKSLWEFTLARQFTGLTSKLDRLYTPCLVITGDKDRIVPVRDSIRLAHQLPNSQLVVITGAGHVPQEEQPSMFMEAVTNFLREIHPAEEENA
jgi:pimeloyl-ACP methyl ester carboxylesterase